MNRTLSAAALASYHHPDGHHVAYSGPDGTEAALLYGPSGSRASAAAEIRCIEPLQGDDRFPSGNRRGNPALWLLAMEEDDLILKGLTEYAGDVRRCYGYSNGGALPTCWHVG